MHDNPWIEFSPPADAQADGRQHAASAAHLSHLIPSVEINESDCPRIVFTIGSRDNGKNACAADGISDGRSAVNRGDIGYAADGRAANRQHRAALARLFDLPAERLIFMEQIHGGRAVRVDSSSCGSGLADRSSAIAGADALVTDDPAVCLVGLSADCPLLAVWSPRDEAGRQFAAIIHAGWRGLAAGVIDAALKLLRSIAATGGGNGVNPSELRALVGPSIGPCCYEVGGELESNLVESGRALERHFQLRDGRPHLDLREVVRYQLLCCGLQESGIFISRRCTACDRRFFSYRRWGDTGRQALAIRLREGGL